MGQGVFNNNLKAGAAIAGAVATLTVSVWLYLNFSPVNYAGMYGNYPATYIYTEAGQKEEVTWLKKNNINSFVSYRLASVIKNSTAVVRNFALMLRRNGITQFGVAYSDASIIPLVDTYNKSCTNDSMKINILFTEYEQYQSGQSRPFFYSLIRQVGNYCKANHITHIPYQGWPSQTDMDSIRVNSSAVALHCYRRHDLTTYVGGDAYGYLSTRLSMAAQANVNTRSIEKFPVLIIYSVENPDSTKTQFGAKYFKENAFNGVHTALRTTYATRATTLMKDNIILGGYQIFVEDQAKKIKP